MAVRKSFLRFYSTALLFLGVNILLTITDELGLLDLLTLVIDIILFLLVLIRIIGNRKFDFLNRA